MPTATAIARTRLAVAGLAVALLYCGLPVPAPPVQHAAPVAEHEGAGADQLLRMVRDPATGRIPRGIRRRELDHARSSASLRQHSGSRLGGASPWQSVGPRTIAGRIRAFAIDRRDPDLLLAGSVAGGIWKSTDGGSTWALMPGDLSPLGVTSVAQDPRAGFQDVWYAASGEYFGTSYSLGISYSGAGIFRSSDNGDTWALLPSTADRDPTALDGPFDFVGRIVVSAQTGSVFLATNGYGIYRSSDGISFSAVLGTPRGHTYSDVQVTAAGTLVAVLSTRDLGVPAFAEAGIHVSTDDGVTWMRRTPGVFPSGHDRSVIALSASNPDLAYVYSSFNGAMSLVKMSIATGAGTDVTGNVAPASRIDLQLGFNMSIAVKPDDENLVLVGANNVLRTFDGFLTSEPDLERAWVGGYSPAGVNYPGHHADCHLLVFDPANAGRLWSAHDGGVSVSEDVTAVPHAWQARSAGLGVTQLYTVALPADPLDDRIMGGSQDNGTPAFHWRGGGVERDASGGDGTFAAFAPSFAYVSNMAGLVLRDHYDAQELPVRDGRSSYIQPRGSQALWFSSFAVDPIDEDVMYYPDRRGTLWRNNALTTLPDGSGGSIDLGWTHLAQVTTAGDPITALAASTRPAHVLYFASSSFTDGVPTRVPGQARPRLYRLDGADAAFFGQVEVGDASWADGAYINDIAVNPQDADELVVVMSNYNIVGTWHSRDGGRSWAAIEGNLTGDDHTDLAGPSMRSAAILPHPDGTTEYFLGTSTGIYTTKQLLGAATQWNEEGVGVTGNVIVAWVRARISDGVVAAATHGRGLFVRSTDPGPVVYESTLPEAIVAPLNGIGIASVSPFYRAPGAGSALYYQVDDGAGLPARIRLVKGGAGLLIHFP